MKIIRFVDVFKQRVEIAPQKRARLHDKAFLCAEPAVEGRDADAGRFGDVGHFDILDPMAQKELRGGINGGFCAFLRIFSQVFFLLHIDSICFL